MSNLPETRQQARNANTGTPNPCILLEPPFADGPEKRSEEFRQEADEPRPLELVLYNKPIKTKCEIDSDTNNL